MTEPSARRRALVATVGTGDVDDVEQSLLAPMLKSIEDGEWDRIVLLPSCETEAAAQQLRDRSPGHAVEIEPLPVPGQENDADACFGHFDAVLDRLIADGIEPSSIVVDFTRGTKAMSAALVLAAIRHDIQVLRYIHSEQRDVRGNVVAGTEKIGEIRTTLATARRRLDQAIALMCHGNFSAAIELLPDPDGPFAGLLPEALQHEAEALRAAAQIYAAWDRLNYAAAVEALKRLGPTAAAAPQPFAPTPAMRHWLSLLAHELDRFDHATMAADLRALACDLLANAERRLRDRQFEDSLLRAYRVLELLGQIRLFDHGYDSAALPPDDETIRAFQAELRKKGSHDFGVDGRTGNLTAPRELGARLLKRMGDPLATRLLAFGQQHGAVQARNRNVSVLIHGFTATAPAEQGPLRKVLADLEKLLIDDDPKAVERLAVARSPAFSEQ